MNRLRSIVFWLCAVGCAAAGVASAQGRGGSIWTTASGDAQRSAAVRTDLRISRESLQKPGFQLLWKRALEVQPRAGLALTQPVFSAPGFITYKGFKGLAFLGGVSGTIYAVDYDLNRMFWTAKLTTAATSNGTPPCPGGVTAVTMTTPRPPAPAGRAPNGEAVGPARGGGERGGTVNAAARGAAPAASSLVARPAVAGLYVVSSAGMLHSLNLQTGTDWFPPARLLPGANATIAGAVLVDSVMYVATTGNCGGVPNGVYAMNLAPVPAPLPDPGALPAAPDAVPASTAVAHWQTHGGGIAGTGPAVASDGTIFVATGDSEIAALDGKTLAQKAYFTPGKTPFTSSPVTFAFGGKELVAAANQDGSIYVIDAASAGGADHRTSIAKSPSGAGDISALCTFQDAGGTRWILAAVGGPVDTPVGRAAHGAIVAFTLNEHGGRADLQPVWISPDLVSPVSPAYVNGVVFAVASGASNAALHALDASTGKPLWDSGASIASPAHGIGPAIDDSQVYVVTTDGTLYTFGFVVER